METSQTHPSGAVADDDLAALARAQGPFLSVVLTTESRIDNAAHRSQQRWRSLASELSSDDVAPQILSAVEDVVTDAHLHEDGLVVVTSAEEILHVEHGPAPSADAARWGPLPHLLPSIAWRLSRPPVVVVLIDRTGADLFALRHAAPDLERTVEGEDGPLRKVGPGGWSQRRFQQRAENTWEENAGEVAAAVTSLVERVGARVVVVAGDVRAVTLLREALPDEIAARVEVVPGERPWDGAGDAIPDEVGEVVQETVARDGGALAERLAEELDQRDLAVEGLVAVASALAAAQVDVLVLGGDAEDLTLWAGPDPLHLSTDPAVLRALGVDDPFEAAAADVLVRAALATGAGVWLDDAGPQPTFSPRDGVAALLRWPVGPQR